MAVMLKPSKTLAKAWVADTSCLALERADRPDEMDEHGQLDHNATTVRFAPLAVLDRPLQLKSQ